MITFFTLNRV